MTAPRKRAFIVMDLEEFDGDAADLANYIDERIPEQIDLTVYTSFEDMRDDRIDRADMFEREVTPIHKPIGS